MVLLGDHAQLFHGLVGGRGKRAQTHEHPKVFVVELAGIRPIIVDDRPDRADRFARDVKRNQQALFDRGHHRLKVGITPLEVP